MKKYLIYNPQRNSYLTPNDTMSCDYNDAAKFHTATAADTYMLGESLDKTCEVVTKDFPDDVKCVDDWLPIVEECGGAKCRIENCPICKNEMY